MDDKTFSSFLTIEKDKSEKKADLLSSLKELSEKSKDVLERIETQKEKRLGNHA